MPEFLYTEDMSLARSRAGYWLYRNPRVERAVIRRHSTYGKLYVADAADLGYSIDSLIEVVRR